MNILQQQNSAKELSDQQLQQELLNPTGALPSYLALSELQRRKDMRSSYQSLQGKPGSSMAEEFARGLGGADVGKYGEAVRGAMPSSPGGEQPPMQMQPPMQAPMQPPMQPPMQDPMQAPQQQFAEGGAIMAPGATKAVGAEMNTLGNNNNGSSPPLPRRDEKDILAGFKKEDGSFNPAALGPLAGIIAGQPVGKAFEGFANSMIGPVPRLMGFKGFADGGPVGSDNGGGMYATKAALAPSGTLSGPTTIQDILKGIGITNQRLGIAGASNMNPYQQTPLIDTFGGADSGGPGSGGASDSGTSSGNSAAADGTAADASAAASAAAAASSADDGTGGGTGATYYRGGVVGLRGGGDPGSFYRDFSDRREDNRLDYLDAMRERIKQSAPRGGMPPINPYGTSNPYVATAVNGGPYDLDETVAASVSKLADQDRWSNPRGNYFPDNYSRPYGTRPGPTPTPMGIGEYPKAAVGEPAPPITYDYSHPSAEGPRASGGLQDAARNREALRNTVMLDSLPNSEPPPAVNAFSFLPPQSTYVPFNPNNPEPTLSNPNGDVDEGGFAPGKAPIPQGKGPVVPGAQPPPPSRRQTSPPGGGIPDARGPSGDAGGGGGGSPIGGIGIALNPDLDGFVGQVRGLQLPDRFDKIEARNQQEREDLKAGREGDKGLAMIQAGMKMAGGTSSNALSNISAGVTAGISEWSAAEKEFRVANQAIRSADNAIAIARAQRDAELLAMSVKVKMHFEEMREKAATRRDAAAAAAGAAAGAREDRIANQAENRAIREASGYQTSISTLESSIDRTERLINSMASNLTTDTTAEQKRLRGKIENLETQKNDMIRQLGQIRSGIAGRSGRDTTAVAPPAAIDTAAEMKRRFG